MYSIFAYFRMSKRDEGTTSYSRPFENMMWEETGVLCDSQGALYIDAETEAKRKLVYQFI